jgi:methyltransferase (TIGR00027 family)
MSTPPDHTAVRVALWRALHLEVDAKPPIFEDRLALSIADPEPNWRERGDMHPQGTSRYRASIVARGRFLEDLVTTEAAAGVSQYVLLGAGLDTFALRRADLAVFEIDRASTQDWKKERLRALGLAAPASLRFVPVDFEKQSWTDELARAGFDRAKPAVIASTGVSMYLSREANEATLRECAKMAKGSTFAMTYLNRIELLESDLREGLRATIERTRAAGTPFVSFFSPGEVVEMARQAGFPRAEHVSADWLNARYFSGRADGFRTSNGEEILVART